MFFLKENEPLITFRKIKRVENMKEPNKSKKDILPCMAIVKGNHRGLNNEVIVSC